MADNDVNVSKACGMSAINLKQSQGVPSWSFKLLEKPQDAVTEPKTAFIKLEQLTVNVDGSPFAYHPEDPCGLGTCERSAVAGSKPICAIDRFSSGKIAIYDAQNSPVHKMKMCTMVNRIGLDGKPVLGEDGKPKKVPDVDSNFKERWTKLWDEIASEKTSWVDLKKIFAEKDRPSARLYYSDTLKTAVTFDPAIIKFKGSSPCRFSGGPSRGNFIAETALRSNVKDNSDCDASFYMDSLAVPFVVLPDHIFTGIDIGDIAVALIKQGDKDRVVFAVVGDRGPWNAIGEASVAFLRQIFTNKDPPINASMADDFEANVGASGIQEISMLFIGGSGKKLAKTRDYSIASVNAAGQAALDAWAGKGAGPARLRACANDVQVNPRLGFH